MPHAQRMGINQGVNVTIAQLMERAREAGQLDIAAGLANHEPTEEATASLLDEWSQSSEEDEAERLLQLNWLADELQR